MAAETPTTPISPMPLIPRGLTVSGVPTKTTSRSATSVGGDQVVAEGQVTCRERRLLAARREARARARRALVDRSLYSRFDRRQIAVGRARRRLRRRGAATQRGYGERCDHEQRERLRQPFPIG